MDLYKRSHLSPKGAYFEHAKTRFSFSSAQLLAKTPILLSYSRWLRAKRDARTKFFLNPRNDGSPNQPRTSRGLMTAQALLAIPGTTHLSSTAKSYSWSQTSSIKRTQIYFWLGQNWFHQGQKMSNFQKWVFGRKLLLPRKHSSSSKCEKNSRQPTTSSSSVIRSDIKSIFDVRVVSKQKISLFVNFKQNWLPRIRIKAVSSDTTQFIFTDGGSI